MRLKNSQNLDDRYLEFDCLALEKRQMLAGVVNVALTAEDVILTGDHEANEIEIEVNGNAMSVRALNGTTFQNGGDYVYFGARSGDLRIKMKSGDDVVRFVNPSSPVSFDDVSIHMGNGSSQLRIAWNQFEIRDDLNIRTGNGASAIEIWGHVYVGDDAKISTGHQGDDVYLDGNIGGNLTIVTRGGNDVVQLGDVLQAESNVKILVGAGNDNVQMTNTFSAPFVGKDLTVETGSGNDTVKLRGARVVGDLKVNVGAGQDTVDILASPPYPGFPALPTFVGGDLRLTLGGGNDTATIDAQVSGTMFINEGPGEDDVTIDV